MDLHNLNEMLAAMEGMTVQTESGTTYVRMEDVRRLMLERQSAEAEAQPDASYKTWDEARAAAKEHLEQGLPLPQPQLGRAVPAFVPSPSAAEGVNS